jgi:hypothetical protein
MKNIADWPVDVGSNPIVGARIDSPIDINGNVKVVQQGASNVNVIVGQSKSPILMPLYSVSSSVPALVSDKIYLRYSAALTAETATRYFTNGTENGQILRFIFDCSVSAGDLTVVCNGYILVMAAVSKHIEIDFPWFVNGSAGAGAILTNGFTGSYSFQIVMGTF